MILDARPPNRRERALKSWIFFMASASTLCHIQIPADKVVVGYADDLVDYYYQFRISRTRNTKHAVRPMANCEVPFFQMLLS